MIPFLSGSSSTPQSWIDSVVLGLLQKGPMVAAMNIQKDFWAYGKGVYRSVTSKTDGKHAVVLVGYNIPERYWIVKNSWGKQWGDEGYAFISWDDIYTNFGWELYSIEIEDTFFKKNKNNNTAGTLSIKFKNETKRLLESVEKTTYVSCNCSETKWPNQLDIYGEIVDGNGKVITDTTILDNIKILLYSGDNVIGTLIRNGNAFFNSLDSDSDVFMKQNMAFELRGVWKKESEDIYLPGERVMLQIPYLLDKTKNDPKPITLNLQRVDNSLQGEFVLNMRDYYQISEACNEIKLLLELPIEGLMVNGVDYWPKQFLFDEENTIFSISISLPVQELNDQINFIIKPEEDDNNSETVALMVNPSYRPDPFKTRQGFLYAAAAAMVIIGIIFLNRCVLIDKYNFWENHIAGKSPEDFYGEPGVINSERCEFLKSKQDFTRVLTQAESKNFRIFLLRQKWRDLETLCSLCLMVYTQPVSFSLNHKTITLSSFEKGDQVFRTREPKLPDNFARIEINNSGGQTTVVFWPTQGFFKDDANAYLPLNKPVYINKSKIFWVGLDNEVLLIKLFIQRNDEEIVLQATS
jgi:hypothetical protein